MKNVLIISEHNHEETQLKEFVCKICQSVIKKDVYICNINIAELSHHTSLIPKVNQKHIALHPHLKFIDSLMFDKTQSITETKVAKELGDIYTMINKNNIDTVFMPIYLDNTLRADFYKNLAISIKEKENVTILFKCM